MAEKRKRGQNFSLEEKDKLVKILLSYRDTILNKKTDGTTNEAKSQAWIAVTNTFNSSATVYRNKDSLMKMWEKMKSESKIYYNAVKQSSLQTGGGPSIIKIDPVLEQVCTILGRACTGITGVADCDADETGMGSMMAFPKVICITNESKIQSSTKTEPSKDTVELSSEEPNQETALETAFEITKTPLWSRRRPQLSQMNERTEAVSTLCASFQEVNKKKEDIEDLKRQLLQDEIAFKKQVYKFQLEAAAKEVEIKTEILLQIKGGGLALQSLLGVPQRKE